MLVRIGMEMGFVYEDDAFPMDPEEHSDSDGDGIGDNADQD